VAVRERERVRRRYRLGPGQTFYSPGMIFAGPLTQVESEREVAAIEGGSRTAGRPTGASWRGWSARASGARAASRRRCATRSSPAAHAASRATASPRPPSSSTKLGQRNQLQAVHMAGLLRRLSLSV
jgi:hypothetical protein